MTNALELPPWLNTICEDHPHSLLFATVSGAHLYGFPSHDSDYDLRGAHILPLDDLVGLSDGAGTVEDVGRRFGPDDTELDLVTHDVKKFMTLMLRRNGYVLEQLHSPLVVRSTPEFEELRSIASHCVTPHHAHHYLGFARGQWKLLLKNDPPRVKPLLYIYRVLGTGIHLMNTGRIEANLRTLNVDLKLPWLEELMEQKTSGDEKALATSISAADGPVDLSFHERQIATLETRLVEARDRSQLPNEPTAHAALNDLLIRIRKQRGFGVG